MSRLSVLLAALSRAPYIWLPKTSGGHTRQYFPIHESGMVVNTGSAVFDTFAVVAKSQPLLFHWPTMTLDEQGQDDLRLLLSRMTYFGRAESWSFAHASMTDPEQIEGVATKGADQTHWRCVCIEEHGKPEGKEYRDNTLERRLAPVEEIKSEAVELLPRTKTGVAAETLKLILDRESPEVLLLRCLLRESGQDMKDGLERPIGTRWVHYATPRSLYDLPRAKPRPRSRIHEPVNLVRYALNTATVGRAVLPPVTDTLLVANHFRNAVMALCETPSPNLSGHETDGAACRNNQHAYWWPVDEDNDGFIDHVMVWVWLFWNDA